MLYAYAILNQVFENIIYYSVCAFIRTTELKKKKSRFYIFNFSYVHITLQIYSIKFPCAVLYNTFFWKRQLVMYQCVAIDVQAACLYAEGTSTRPHSIINYPILFKNPQLFCCKKQTHVYFICSCDLNMVCLGIGNSPLPSFSVLFVLVFFQHSKHARITPLSLLPLLLAFCHIWRPAIDRGVCDHVATCDSFG